MGEWVNLSFLARVDRLILAIYTRFPNTTAVRPLEVVHTFMAYMEMRKEV